MKKYTFLIRPLVFICSLVFATWLVFKIERLRPSDFGRYRAFLEDPSLLKNKAGAPWGKITDPVLLNERKEYLKRLFSAHYEGKISDAELEKELNEFFGH